jgi:hypothetical protein
MWHRAKLCSPATEQLAGILCLSLPLTIVCAFVLGSGFFDWDPGYNITQLIPYLLVAFAAASVLAFWLCVLLTLQRDTERKAKIIGWVALLTAWTMFGFALVVITSDPPLFSK